MNLNNRRIAKNTAFLYFRMLFLMFISLFTSRVLLKALGVDDFGISNVVGGFVIMFAFVNRSMSGVTQRFLTFELGRKDIIKINKVFNTTLLIHIVLGLSIIIFAETIGLWFMYNRMVIPPERFTAALWVFHTSVLITALGVSYVPFNAIIISHERMNVFAWISILEGIIKILIAYSIYITHSDKLVFYSLLMLASQVLIVSIYVIYAKIHFNETKFEISFNKSILKEILAFLGWNFYGTMGSVITNQGINVLLNMFFGVAVNAARGIAVQVENAVIAFAENIQTAINPQITKNYAQNKMASMHQLIFMNCKVTFFVMFVLSIPLFFKTDSILNLWLENRPKYSDSFLRLLLISIFFDVLSKPFVTAANATGQVKRFYQIIGTVLLLVLPLTYLMIKFTGNPNSAFVCIIIMQIAVFSCRILLVKNLIYLELNSIVILFIRLAIVAILVTSCVFGINLVLSNSFISLMFITIIGVITTSFFMYFVSLTKTERKSVSDWVNQKISKCRTIQ